MARAGWSDWVRLSRCREGTDFQQCLPQDDDGTGQQDYCQGGQGAEATDCLKSSFRQYSDFHKQDSGGKLHLPERNWPPIQLGHGWTPLPPGPGLGFPSVRLWCQLPEL